MKFIYPAVFRKNEDGRYKAFFPDLACCEAEGDTLDDAIDNANEAAYNWIYAEVMDSSLRTGMFCRLGSVDDKRPVAVTAW